MRLLPCLRRLALSACPNGVCECNACSVLTTMVAAPYPDAPNDNRIRFQVDFAAPTTVTGSDFVASSSNLALGAPTVTALSKTSYYVVVEVQTLESGSVMLELPANNANPVNVYASATDNYVPVAPVVFSTLGDSGTVILDYEFDIHVLFAIPVTGVTDSSLDIVANGAVVMSSTVSAQSPTQYTWRVRLDATPGDVSFSVAAATAGVAPPHLASNVYTLNFIGRCADDECTVDSEGRVCVHVNAGGLDSTCHDFQRHDNGDIMYPIVCPPGTDLCANVAVPEEEPTAIGMCTACAGESAGPCQHVSDGTCHRFIDTVNKVCPPGTQSCNECERLMPCDHGVCVDGINDYSCLCEVNYYGKNCDNYDDCIGNNCDVNHGTCVDGDGAFTCACEAGYGTATCGTEINECDAVPCSNGGACTDLLADFSCDCSGTGFEGVTCDDDIQECATGTHNCLAVATCSETPGSFTCTCPQGFAGDGITACTDIDECSTGTHNCHADAACSNTAGSFTCACNAGYFGDGVTCNNVDECSGNTHNCHANAACSDTPGSFNCACNSGYSGDGVTCTDDDECSAGTHNCHADAACSNTAGSFTCACNSGYSGDGVTCTDVDECSAGAHNCHVDATCSNTPGSFTCACNSGYSGDGVSCADDDECSAGTHNCNAGYTCSNTAGSFTCDDINECLDAQTCGATLNCINTDGSFICDPDECTDGTHNCHASAQCTDTIGSFTCACNAGYTGDGVTCADVDECATDDGSLCGGGYSCSNTVGSYTCDDVDECSLGTDSCGSGYTCSNTVGSFTCNDIDECLAGTASCGSGYVCANTDGSYTCDNVDECAAGTHNCHADAQCTDTDGSFTCACNAGYTGDGVSCTEINECDANPCQNGGACVDGVNSYSCVCAPQTSGDNCELHDCGVCAGVSPCQHLNDDTCHEYMTSTDICPPGTRRCANLPVLECGCAGQSSGPCRTAFNGVCYEADGLGNCPAGTALCAAPSLQSLGVDTEATLVRLDLSGFSSDDATLVTAVTGAIVTATSVSSDDVSVVGIASLKGSDDLLVSALIQGQTSGSSVDIATAVSAIVDNGVLDAALGATVSSVGGEVNVVEEAPADDSAPETNDGGDGAVDTGTGSVSGSVGENNGGDSSSGQESGATSGQAVGGAPVGGDDSDNSFYILVIAGFVVGGIVLVLAAVVVSRMRRGDSRVHQIAQPSAVTPRSAIRNKSRVAAEVRTSQHRTTTNSWMASSDMSALP